MKKLAPGWSLVLLALTSFSPTPATAAAVVSLAVPGTASLGDSVKLDVTITGVVDLYSFQFDLAFNPQVLAAITVTEGAILPGVASTFFVPGTIDNTLGSVAATADTRLGAIPGVTGDGTLFTVQFTVIGTGTSALTPSNLFLFDSNLNPLIATASGASLVATPLPTSALLMLSGFFATYRVLSITSWLARRRTPASFSSAPRRWC